MLTDSNSILTLSCPDVFSGPQQIQGYSTDDAWNTESVKPGETLMGVDGILSGAYVPFPVPFKFMLQADSNSITDVMDVFFNTIVAASETYEWGASLIVPGISKQWTGTTGFLTAGMVSPGAKKILQMQTYEITFQSFLPSAYSGS